MKKYSFKIFLIGAIAMMSSLTSCVKDLETTPKASNVTVADQLFNDPAAYKEVLAKLYAGLAVSGQEGPAGNSDISGIDEGFGEYLRGYWYLQEFTTDEAVTGWGDSGLADLHNQDWNSNNDFVKATYYRIMYQVTACNSFLRETTAEKLSARGVTGQLLTDVQEYRSEARFLRALSYYHALDLFGSFPFVTEEDEVGYFFPPQKSRTELFNFVESELLDIEGSMPAPKSNEYARADQAAAWTLLAKLYLNAEVYTGTARYSDCITYANKVINAGYTPEPAYKNLFLADNNTASGVIFPIAFDGTHTQTYGGTTFLIRAAIGGSMKAREDFGVKDGWGGNRTTKNLVNMFSSDFTGYPTNYFDQLNTEFGTISNWGIVGSITGWGSSPDLPLYESGTTNVLNAYFVVPVDGSEIKFRADSSWDSNFGDPDGPGGNIAIAAGFYKVTVNISTQEYSFTKLSRNMFYTDGQSLEIESIPTFTDGYAISKFKNIDKNGNPGSDASGEFTDTDFPLFRIADVYLMYAEAVLRGGNGGDEGTAITYVNKIRERSYAAPVTSIDLDFILNERARELYWEGTRRTDLIRYGRFTDGNYVWPWKGGVAEGTSVPSYRNLFPIPSTDLNANPNLTQNPEY
jgi:hypothetical protein